MSKQDLEDRAFIETVDDIDEDQQLREAFLKISSITERISDIEKKVSEFESMKKSEASLVDKVKQAEELLKFIKSNVTSDKK